MNRPIVSTEGACAFATAACVITFIIVALGGKTQVDPAETAAIAATCQAKGLVARHEVGGGHIRTFCQRPEDIK